MLVSGSKPIQQAKTAHGIRSSDFARLYIITLAVSVGDVESSTGQRSDGLFCLRLTMNERISYSQKAAEFLGSAVAAILLSYVVKKCEENNTDAYEDVDLQFDIGFSDVEFFSALKILREKGYMQSRTLRGGSRLYVPIPEFLDLRSDQ